MTCSPKEIKFHNQPLVTFEQDGIHYTALKPICENIGLVWNAQYERIKRDEVLNSTIRVIRTVAEDNKNRETICLPIDYLNGWLFGVNVKRVKPEIRDALIMYKKECYQALHDYWANGKAERTSIDERAGLRDAVEKLARKKKGLNYPDAYSMIHQYMNVKHIDEIPRDDIQTAIAYCHQVALEGEIIPAESAEEKKPDYNYPLETADPSTREFANANLTHDVILNERRPEWELVLQLEKDGYDVTGVKVRIDAMYKLVGWYRDQQDELKEIAFRMGRLATNTYSLTEHRGKNVRFA